LYSLQLFENQQLNFLQKSGPALADIELDKLFLQTYG